MRKPHNKAFVPAPRPSVGPQIARALVGKRSLATVRIAGQSAVQDAILRRGIRRDPCVVVNKRSLAGQGLRYGVPLVCRSCISQRIPIHTEIMPDIKNRIQTTRNRFKFTCWLTTSDAFMIVNTPVIPAYIPIKPHKKAATINVFFSSFSNIGTPPLAPK